MATAAKVNFETNIPQVLALQFAEGKAVASQYNGEEIMFTLVDGRRMYLAPFVAEKLKGIPANKPFEICKREVSRGKIEYQVRPIEETRAAASSWQSPAAPVAEPARRVSTETSNQPQHTRTEPTAAPVFSTRIARYMSAYKDACDVLIATREYLSYKGFDRDFGFDDVRPLAATMMIDEQKGGAR